MILVVDDDSAIRMSLKLLLSRSGYDVELADGPAQAIEIVRAVTPQLVLLDMNFSRDTSGIEGLTLLRQIKVFQPDTPVILMTAWGSIPLAVEGIKAGAIDFISKPWDNRALLRSIATVIELHAPAAAPVSKDDFDRSLIVGHSPQINAILETVRRISATNASVLIMGENGTGKELIAETIHRNSPRNKGPFIKVNLGGISQSLFESEMFGYRRGAFTGATTDRKGRFELADGGTIFLDEIGDLDIGCQVKLLRVLQEQTFEPLGDSHSQRVDMRVVCATNADLPAMVAKRTFREDLFYRINLITVTLPPLRERNSDIPLLAKHFANKASGSKLIEFSADALEFLSRLPYPGNIRELKNLVERTIIVSGKQRLEAADFESQYHPDIALTATQTSTIEGSERQMIIRALENNGGNLSRTAMQLGISRQALYRRMEKFDIRQ